MIDEVYIMGGMYVLAGIMHFIKPKIYLKIMPPYLPYHLPLVYLSGLFELVFGALVMYPDTQQIGAWGIITTLIGVFPANIYMLTSYRGKNLWFKLALWLRLPLQGFLIYWAYTFV